MPHSPLRSSGIELVGSSAFPRFFQDPVEKWSSLGVTQGGIGTQVQPSLTSWKRIKSHFLECQVLLVPQGGCQGAAWIWNKVGGFSPKKVALNWNFYEDLLPALFLWLFLAGLKPRRLSRTSGKHLGNTKIPHFRCGRHRKSLKMGSFPIKKQEKMPWHFWS